jgi:hypothetical protein
MVHRLYIALVCALQVFCCFGLAAPCRILTFRVSKVSTVGSMDLGCRGSVSVHIAKLQQVLVPYMGLSQFSPHQGLTVQASQVSVRKKEAGTCVCLV